jgi:hypothetical protein
MTEKDVMKVFGFFTLIVAGLSAGLVYDAYDLAAGGRGASDHPRTVRDAVGGAIVDGLAGALGVGGSIALAAVLVVGCIVLTWREVLSVRAKEAAKRGA